MSKFQNYTKKPVTIKAIEWDGSNETYAIICEAMLSDGHLNMPSIDNVQDLKIQTLEGEMTADVGDFIIRGIKAEYYPCKPDIFWASYDENHEIEIFAVQT